MLCWEAYLQGLEVVCIGLDVLIEAMDLVVEYGEGA
jgi:hypothetical protein